MQDNDKAAGNLQIAAKRARDSDNTRRWNIITAVANTDPRNNLFFLLIGPSKIRPLTAHNNVNYEPRILHVTIPPEVLHILADADTVSTLSGPSAVSGKTMQPSSSEPMLIVNGLLFPDPPLATEAIAHPDSAT